MLNDALCEERIRNSDLVEIDSENDTITLTPEGRAAAAALDQVAYVRFASVYRSFQDISEFQDEIVRLQKSSTGEPNEGEQS